MIHDYLIINKKTILYEHCFIAYRLKKNFKVHNGNVLYYSIEKKKILVINTAKSNFFSIYFASAFDFYI